MPDNTPFFVIGAGRSGTTLLRLILAAHSRLHIPPETWFILPLVEALPLAEPLNADQVDRAVDIMTRHYRWPDMAVADDDLRRDAHALVEPRLADILELVYRRHLVAAGKQRFGDKTPLYVQIVPQLATIYPGTKFIHLIRDGRDVAMSCIDLDWTRYYQRREFEWTLAMQRRREYQQSPYAGQILEVRYEELVGDMQATVQRICTFLGEHFEPAMLNWQHLASLIPDRERHIHDKITQPVARDATAAWRRKLSGPECFAMEACLHRDLAQLGYPLRFASPLWRPLLGLTRGLLYGTAPWLLRGVRALKRRHLLPQRLYL